MLAQFIYELNDEVVKLKALSKDKDLDDNPPAELTMCLSHLTTIIKDMQEILKNNHTLLHRHEAGERFFDHHIR